jgi:hypothetical protein
LTKTDEVLLALGTTTSEYLKSVRPFRYQDKTYRLINNFLASHYMKCGICGNYPIVEVSVIRTEDGDRLNGGNSCIDRLTGQSVSKWFRNYRRKRKNIIQNRKYIDGLSSILASYNKKELHFQISGTDIEKLHRAFERMLKGLNPTRKQEQLVRWYTITAAR